eukprot:TRINITY_DN4896_c0_g1_i2.p1 TRINITY_DN4896_c0_g1~~TRINITY_DN4896_c0_g1_i2.p1  ORF type:complete len:190 (+),score=17.30 TRINITY_DN4896_c0_g1_i2:38-571(+)
MSNDTGLTDEHRIISVKGTYDEVHEVDGLEELPSSLAVTPQPISAGSQDLGFSPPPLKFARGDTPPKSPIMSNQDSYGDDTLMGDANEPLSDTGSLSDSTEDDLIETMEVEGAYDPAMYKNLNVKGDVEDLFKFITTYATFAIVVLLDTTSLFLDINQKFRSSIRNSSLSFLTTSQP